jgi:hypothetical protein
MKKIIRLTESDLARIVKRVIKENEEDTIRIPRKYDGVRMELGRVANPQDIIDMYNEVVASEGESVPLEKYEDGHFWNEFMDDIMVDVILDELNYAIVGEEEDYDDEEDDDDNWDDDEKTHNAFVQKIDDKIEFLLNGDYDNEPEYMEELYGAIVKLANTPTRKRAISYIKNKLK